MLPHNKKFSQLTTGAIIRVGLICNLSFWLPAALLTAIFAFFGAFSVTFNDSPVTGAPAFFGGLAVALAFALACIGATLIGAVLSQALLRRVGETPLGLRPPPASE